MTAKSHGERTGLYIKTVLLQLRKASDGSLSSREVVNQVRPELDDLSPYELEINLKSNRMRWEIALHFYSINATKAGWIIKKGGIWYITDEGQKIADKPASEVYALMQQKYGEWRAANPPSIDPNASAEAESSVGSEDRNETEAAEAEAASDYSLVFENAESDASDAIETYLYQQGPYDFQDLVAALLRGMGYYTPFVAPKGRDGGVDIQAYRDPLGSMPPRLVVQVKQRPNTKTTGPEMRALEGGLRRDGDIGLFVSTGGFTPDASSIAKNASRHIETIDTTRFIALWKEHYAKMPQEDQALMPMREIMFLAPEAPLSSD